MYLDGRRSKFPNEIDSIIEMFSIPSSYKGYIKRYQELSLKSNLNANERKEFNDLMVELEPYIFDVEKWNRFGDILINMQKFFKEGVEPYIENEKRKVAEHSKEQVAYMNKKKDEAETHITNTKNSAESYIDKKKDETKNYIDSKKDEAETHIINTKDSAESYINRKKSETTTYIDNKVSTVDKHMDKQINYFDGEVGKFTTRGGWHPNTLYSEKNVITYDGRGYIALKESRGEIPSPNSDYWSLIADKGEKGDPSLNINFKGEYDGALSYKLGDAVTYNGLWYYAKKNTKGNSPVEEEYWEISPHSVWVDIEKPFDTRIPLWIEV